MLVIFIIEETLSLYVLGYILILMSYVTAMLLFWSCAIKKLPTRGGEFLENYISQFLVCRFRHADILSCLPNSLFILA